MRVADYFLLPQRRPRTFIDPAGKPVMTLEVLTDGIDKFRLRQTDAAGAWSCDWLLKVEANGDITEYGDTYPDSRVFYVPGHEIVWAERASGTIWPNPFKSSFSKYGTFGSFFCLSQLQPDGSLDIYWEQKFGRTDRGVYHCLHGSGMYAATYYAEGGASETITSLVPQPIA